MDVVSCDITHWIALEPVWSPELLLIVGAIFSVLSKDFPNKESGCLAFHALEMPHYLGPELTLAYWEQWALHTWANIS